MNYYNKENTRDYPDEALNYLNDRFVHYLYANASDTVVALMINKNLPQEQRLIELSHLEEYRRHSATFISIAREMVL